MSITCDEATGIYRIDTPNSTLILAAYNGYLTQPYWGPRCGQLNAARYAEMFTPQWGSPQAPGTSWSPDTTPMVMPTAGSGDYRRPALHVRYADGTTASRLRFDGAEVCDELYVSEGMPYLYALPEEKAETLVCHLVDEYRNISVDVFYSTLADHDAIITAATVTNDGDKSCHVLSVASACLNLPRATYDQITLSGCWARERQLDRQRVMRGAREIGSCAGSSGHKFNPFTALVEAGATESTGRAYGFSLIYSGDFTMVADTEQNDCVRVTAACGSRDFAWKLEPGDSFETPLAVCVFSAEGIGAMSRAYHRIYRKNLSISAWKDRPRPVLVNNWEATYFGFTQEKLEALMDASAPLGIELFVLDDGWFGHRDSDNCSLGDWAITDAKKLPKGIPGVAAAANQRGMKFGLWFEPEMISPDSELYRQHPEWAIQLEGLTPQQCRNQLTLDMSRADVCDFLIETVSKVLSSAPIAYVKWDYNRYMTDMRGSTLSADRQGEMAHRFILGTWRVMRELTVRFPEILFEGCASGGGRFDAGMLHYMPQFWTSDDTDARERLAIQYGTSIVYPLSSISAHVSASPNHQCGRVTPFGFRGAVAQTGSFGYELDITKLTDDEKAQITKQVAAWKQRERLLREGDLYRLLSPFEGRETAHVVVSEDKAEALLFYYQELNQPCPTPKWLRLAGLDPAKRYAVADFEMSPENTAVAGFPTVGQEFDGADLQTIGVQMPRTWTDYSYTIVHFVAK